MRYGLCVHRALITQTADFEMLTPVCACRVEAGKGSPAVARPPLPPYFQRYRGHSKHYQPGPQSPAHRWCYTFLDGPESERHEAARDGSIAEERVRHVPDASTWLIVLCGASQPIDWLHQEEDRESDGAHDTVSGAQMVVGAGHLVVLYRCQ
jgi:hypothetical protein